MSGPPADRNARYGRPPVTKRWRQGQSGLPRGRRKRLKTKLEVLDELLLKSVKVTSASGPQRLPAITVILRQLTQKEATGDKRALAIRLQYEAIAAAMPGRPVELQLIENDYTLALRHGNRTKKERDEP